MSTLIKDVFDYAANTYGVEPDYPFSSAPTYAVLRHLSNRKWFALIGDVRHDRLGLSGEGKIDIMNVKCDPILSGSLLMQEGYYPAYHMNHESWITILLDGTVPLEEIYQLLDLSYELTMVKPKKKRGGA
ncbi:MAG: MmcQ/YjbR family DNA-binding protein [Ruminococcus sp.]|nr:MmcQ/YjbR family DNA-binding protein [Ruminococcus sp.]